MSVIAISPKTSYFCSNMTFDYRISTNYFNHSVTMTVVDCEMESDKNGDCFYDTLTLYDGKKEIKIDKFVFLSLCFHQRISCH